MDAKDDVFKHSSNFLLQWLELFSRILFCFLGKVVLLDCLLDCLGWAHPIVTKVKTKIESLSMVKLLVIEQ